MNFFKNGLLVFCSIILTLLAAEGFLRFFPVNEGLHVQPVNEQNPIIHFKPDRSSTWSRFADFSMVNTVHSNNYGFLNDQEYDPNGTLPLIAVIGDSYVEAAMVPYKDTLHGRLASELKGKWRVYSFAASGAPLSQYLAFARFARNEFRPQKMVFVVVGNDFDESLLKYKQAGGFHYFTKDKNGDLDLQRMDYAPSALRNMVKRSVLAMYLITNTNIHAVISNIFSPPNNRRNYVGQTSADANDERITLSQKAVRAFLSALPAHSGLPPQSVLFIVDAMRPHVYTKQGSVDAKGSYFDIMRTYFMNEAAKKGYKVIDLEKTFKRDFIANGLRFEFPKDGHWNPYGHEIAFEAIRANHLPTE